MLEIIKNGLALSLNLEKRLSSPLDNVTTCYYTKYSFKKTRNVKAQIQRKGSVGFPHLTKFLEAFLEI